MAWTQVSGSRADFSPVEKVDSRRHVTRLDLKKRWDPSTNMLNRKKSGLWCCSLKLQRFGKPLWWSVSSCLPHGIYRLPWVWHPGRHDEWAAVRSPSSPICHLLACSEEPLLSNRWVGLDGLCVVKTVSNGMLWSFFCDVEAGNIYAFQVRLTASSGNGHLWFLILPSLPVILVLNCHPKVPYSTFKSIFFLQRYLEKINTKLGIILPK